MHTVLVFVVELSYLCITKMRTTSVSLRPKACAVQTNKKEIKNKNID